MRTLSVFFDILFPPRKNEILVRTSEVRQVGALVSPRLVSLEGCEVHTLLPYHEPLVQALIVEAKFHGNEKARSLLAGALADYLLELQADAEAFGSEITLVPIPLSKKRRRARGFNQCEALLHAMPKYIRERMGIDTSLLERTRDTLPQTTLKRAKRLENMQGAFATTNTVEQNRTYIIVDDVVTTGATLAAALTALKNAGATQVLTLALAHS